MKKVLFTSLFVMVMSISIFAQEIAVPEHVSLPEIEIKTLDGTPFNTPNIQNNGKPMMVIIWSSYCHPAVAELDAIADEYYDEWVKRYGVKIYAISIDDSRTIMRVAPFVQKKQYPFEVLLDSERSLWKTLKNEAYPVTYILDGEGKIMWKHIGYNYDILDIIETKLHKYKE